MGRRSRRLATAAAVTAVALWAATAVYSVAADPVATTTTPPAPDASPTPSATAAPGVTAAPAAPADVDEVVRELQDFVEEHQGLEFKDDVDVEVLDDAAFQRAWGSGGRAGGDADAAAEAQKRHDTYLALGLVSPETDLDDAEKSFDAGIGGFYDIDSGDLVVRGAALTPFVRGILVHELTHAIQFQNFDFKPGPEELVTPIDGLLEGSATWTQSAYYDSLSEDEQHEYDIEENQAFGDYTNNDISDGLSRLWSFPYEVGEEFVTELTEGGDKSRLKDAYRDPPLTSEQLLHVEAYEREDDAKRVAKPLDDGDVVARGTLGEAALYVVLAEQLSDQVAEAAAAGWGGDAYVVWRSGGQLCARIHVAMDTPAEATELRLAFRSYARKRRGTSVSEDAGLTVTMCEAK